MERRFGLSGEKVFSPNALHSKRLKNEAAGIWLMGNDQLNSRAQFACILVDNRNFVPARSLN